MCIRDSAEAMAMTIIALVDGLWLELCIAPDLMTATRARGLVEAVLQPVLASGTEQPTPYR